MLDIELESVGIKVELEPLFIEDSWYEPSATWKQETTVEAAGVKVPMLSLR